MAAAMARGWAGELGGMLFSDSGSGRARALAEELGGEAVANEELAARSDLLVLAVKPNKLEQVAPQLGAARRVVSVLAATPLERLSAALPDHALVLVGAPEDVGVADSVAAGWRPPVLQLCGQVTPRETAAVLRRTELFLGPDSGPMHLAASAGVPCAIAFSARDYRGKWYPAGREHRIAYHTVECAVCGLETCIERKKLCLTSITVEEMFAAAMAAWKDGRRLAVSRTS